MKKVSSKMKPAKAVVKKATKKPAAKSGMSKKAC